MHNYIWNCSVDWMICCRWGQKGCLILCCKNSLSVASDFNCCNCSECYEAVLGSCCFGRRKQKDFASLREELQKIAERFLFKIYNVFPTSWSHWYLCSVEQKLHILRKWSLPCILPDLRVQQLAFRSSCSPNVLASLLGRWPGCT